MSHYSREQLLAAIEAAQETAQFCSENSLWLGESQARRLVEEIALHALCPEKFALPREMRVQDWVAVGWDASSGTSMTRQLPNMTKDEARACISGLDDWWGVIPADVVTTP